MTTPQVGASSPTGAPRPDFLGLARTPKVTAKGVRPLPRMWPTRGRGEVDELARRAMEQFTRSVGVNDAALTGFASLQEVPLEDFVLSST